MPSLYRLLTLPLIGCLAAAASAQTLNVDVTRARTSRDMDAEVVRAATRATQNIAALTKQSRDAKARVGAFNSDVPLSFPMTVRLQQFGRMMPTSNPVPRPPGPITLDFDNSFPADYRTFLQGVFNNAQPFLNAVFGQPAEAGTVKVKNIDSTIPDRQAVVGGIYVPDAPGGPEIQFAIYSNPEAAAVNFIHTLLLAYLGPNQYGFDAFNEGLVRAATMRVSRIPAATPGLDQGVIESILDNTYDASAQYDWYNQRALGGQRFIAPNLLNTELPAGGSVGGLYLVRYQMAGSAWQKVLAEHPAFLSQFNSAFYANPSIKSNVPALVALAQNVLNTLRPGDPTVEGLSFADWYERQFVLETKDTRGPKLLVEPVPIVTDLAGNDFGVFLVQAHWFTTGLNGDETLLSGTSYPIFWEGQASLNRVFPSSQEDRMDIAGGYGSVVPNLPNLIGTPYRAAVDIPVSDQLERVYLPAGAIATASNTTERDFYGTVTGVNLSGGDTLRLQVSVGATPISDVPVTNNAFGVRINTPEYLDYATVTVSVVRRTNNVDTTLLTRKIAKGPGSLALDLRVGGDGSFTFPGGLPKGMSMIGFPLDPYLSYQPDILGTAPAQTLVARYNASRARYDLFPDTEPFKLGHGYFVRMENAVNPFTVEGRFHPNIEMSVALKPGWNMVTTPINQTVPTNRVRSVRAADFPQLYAAAVGVDIGTEFFTFQPGPADAATGAPETGTLVPATQFEPGKAYFVRALAPEGVSLTFAPASPLSPVRGSATVVANPGGWRMRVTVSDKNRSSYAEIGQTSTATPSFDPREDSGLPPGIGGLQVVVQGAEAMFRDLRKLGAPEDYTVRLEGLNPGKAHNLQLNLSQGQLVKFRLYDENGQLLGSYRNGAQITIFPKTNSTKYTIRVEGGAR